jgi:hypothetical protein
MIAVEVLHDEGGEIVANNQNNLKSALRCALLCLPKQFTETQLYTAICNLSYSGITSIELDQRLSYVEVILE